MVEGWVQHLGWDVPDDLLELWSQTGGGDCFESETIFRPSSLPSSVPYFSVGDDVDSANECHVQRGMPKLYLAFHDGSFLSAVRLSDQAFVTLGQAYKETAVFPNLNAWYMTSLRAEFARGYGLPPL